MFTKQTLNFFRQLERNNKREWFTPRKEMFQELCYAPMLELCAAINGDLRKFAVDHVTEPPGKAIYRIYRDTRFSKDKTPYKTHIAATFGRRGFPRTAAAGFYFGVSHKEVEIGGGTYMPEPEQLAAIRKKIASDSKSLRKILESKELKKLMGDLLGEKLARVPKGFDPDHPAAEFLKMKQLYFYVTLPASLATKPMLKAEVVKRFKALTPFINYLNEAIIESTRSTPGDDRPRRPAPMF